MSHTPWKLLSVADFLERYRTQPDIQTIESDASSSDLIWQRQTVKTFFANYQWRPQHSVPQPTAAFGLRLSVLSYFQHFAWDAPAPQLQKEPSLPAATDEVAEPPISLKNFSNLF